MEDTEPMGVSKNVSIKGMCYFYQWKERKIVLVDNAVMAQEFSVDRFSFHLASYVL